MKTIIKTGIISCLTLLLLQCSSDDQIQQQHPNLGVYEVTSLTSSKAMDLNYDGIESVDFKEELQRYFYTNYAYHELEVFNNSFEPNEILVVPTMGTPVDVHEDNHPDPTYRFKPDARIHTLVMDGMNISSFIPQEPFDAVDDQNDEPGQARLKTLVFNNEKTITITMDQLYFDHLRNEWFEISLIAVFNKILENSRL